MNIPGAGIYCAAKAAIDSEYSINTALAHVPILEDRHIDDLEEGTRAIWNPMHIHTSMFSLEVLQ